jgi:hypothetical protein
VWRRRNRGLPTASLVSQAAHACGSLIISHHLPATMHPVLQRSEYEDAIGCDRLGRSWPPVSAHETRHRVPPVGFQAVAYLPISRPRNLVVHRRKSCLSLTGRIRSTLQCRLGADPGIAMRGEDCCSGSCQSSQGSRVVARYGDSIFGLAPVRILEKLLLLGRG